MNIDGGVKVDNFFTRDQARRTNGKKDEVTVKATGAGATTGENSESRPVN